jgi:hypothetical protein
MSQAPPNQPIPPLAPPATPPLTPPMVQQPIPPMKGDATGGVIPYKNPAALLAYYAGVFSVLPFFPIGLAALVLGIYGLRNRAREPAIRGSVHAWIGIVVGGIFGTLWLVVTIVLIVVKLR